MTLYLNSMYKFFKPESPPPGNFGETYVIAVGIHGAGPCFQGEYYILTKRPDPRLHHDKCSLSATNFPMEFDNDFMVDERSKDAEIYLNDCLDQNGCLDQRVKLMECKAPLMGCWVLNVFHEQIREIAQTTECESLSRYLSMLITSSISIRCNS